MRAEIKALHQRLKTTIVYVTHDQIEAMTMADKIVVLQGGKVEQIGTPLELYDHPRNVFVAGFLGSPAMNFLEGGLTKTGGRAILRLADGTVVPLSDAPAAALDRDIVVGVRPEDIDLGSEGNGVQANVVVVEPTGSETHIELEVAGRPVTWLLRQRADIRPGQTISVTFATSRAHFFDKTTGERC